MFYLTSTSIYISFEMNEPVDPPGAAFTNMVLFDPSLDK